jgi:uncharacterized membrane protein
MSSTADKLVEDYLKRLKGETSDLPRAARRELIQEISDHIAEARADASAASDVETRNVLDRVGEPAEIAAEARERFGVGGRPRRLEIAALILLPIGGVVLPVLGWLVGVTLLWISDAWTTRDKLIGTLIVPGGLLLPLALGLLGSGSGSCIEISSGGPGPRTARTCADDGSDIDFLKLALIAVIALAPLATTAYLALRMKARRVPAGGMIPGSSS